MAFNPIIDFILKQEQFGYELNNKKVITLPYADDFCLITTNMRVQQRLISEIDNHIQGMGMRLKPVKCRSFSIQQGKPSVIHFKISEAIIPSIHEEEQKFLGKVIFFTGKSTDVYTYFKDVIETKLKNIDETTIRNEYKMWIYQNYFLPSIRFLLTVHDITFTDIQKIDSLSHRYLKKWAGIPRCGTNLIFHMRDGLNIPTIFSLYEEAHSLNHTAMRIKGDETVNLALDSCVSRESKLQRKKSITVRAEGVFRKALNQNCIGGELPSFPDETWNKEKPS